MLEFHSDITTSFYWRWDTFFWFVFMVPQLLSKHTSPCMYFLSLSLSDSEYKCGLAT